MENVQVGACTRSPGEMVVRLRGGEVAAGMGDGAAWKAEVEALRWDRKDNGRTKAIKGDEFSCIKLSYDGI